MHHKTYFFTFFFCILGTVLHAQWVAAPSMSSPRYNHTATTLADGRVLVLGGYDGIGTSLTAEVFDPSDSSWTAAALQPDPLSEHTATLLDDGRVLVTGGYDGGTTNYPATKLYDPVADSWASGPSMRAGRSGHTATKLTDGKVLIVGGFDGNQNQAVVEIFDPALDSLVLADSIGIGRSYHTATLMANGRVMVTGGFNPDFGFQLTSAEIYDPVADAWSDAGALGLGRDYHASILLNDGRVMVSGGRFFTNGIYQGIFSAEVYDTTTNAWTYTANLPDGISYHQMFHLPDGRILLPGGTDTSGNTPFVPSETFIYDPGMDSWTEAPMLATDRFRYAAVKLLSEDILVTGGFSSSAEIFDVIPVSITDGADPLQPSLEPHPLRSLGALRFQNPQGRPATLRVYDLSGRLVFSMESQTEAFGLQAADFAPGLHLYQLQLSDGAVTQGKLLVE